MTNYWQGGSGTQVFTDTANWSLGAAPVNTNDVVINFGNSVITGLDDSAVTLASLTTGPNFTGTIGTPSLPLKIGVSGTVIINSPNSTQICLDLAATAPAIDVLATGQNSNSPPTFGQESLIIQGGASGCSLAIAGSTTNVGIATQSATTTAQIDHFKINGGFLNINSGVTTTDVTQSASNGVGGNTTGGVVTMLCAATTVTQNGLACNLVTGGAVKITTLVITGNAIIGNRPASGTIFDTLTVGPQANVDFSQDPRSGTYTNPIIGASGGSFTSFNAAQIKMVSPNVLTFALQTCGVGNPGFTVNVGNVATATFA